MGGYGSVKLLFIGEAPGEFEDRLGIPFVGPSGKVLDYIIKYAHYPFKYTITNIVNCRPMTVLYLDQESENKHDISQLIPNEDYEIIDKNREPEQAEIKACAPHIEELIADFKPHGIVRLGLVAQLHYQPRNNMPVLDLMHPAKILRLERKVLTVRKQARKLENFVEKIANVHQPDN